jgi:transcriptional adapter 1
MMATPEKDKVTIAKQQLQASLTEENWSKYLGNMKQWFRQKCTKEEFDFESRKLFTHQQIHLHNQFLLAILNKIDSVSPARSDNGLSALKNSRKRKKSIKITERVNFEVASIHEYIGGEEFTDALPSSSTQNTSPRYAAQELFLPDAGLIMGRLLIATFENNLNGTEDAVVEMIVIAVQNLLKNIISSVLMKKKQYRVTADGKFFYDVGQIGLDPKIRNSVTRRKIDDEPLELDKEITSSAFLRRNNDESIFLAACEEV